MVILVFAHPIIDALGAKHIAAASAFLGVDCNISADWAVEHVSCEVGEALFVVSELAHFVDFVYII